MQPTVIHHTTPSIENVAVTLIGPLSVTSKSGSDLTPASRRSRAIVAYLVRMEGRPVPRQRLSTLLWDRVSEAQAKASLRQSLYEISRSLVSAEAPALTIDREKVSLHATTDCAALTGGHLPFSRQVVKGNIDHILEGMDGLTPGFDEWLQTERAQIANEVNAAAISALDHLKVRAAPPAERIEIARAVLAFDACHEKASRMLMRALLESGDMVGLVREYQRCKETLKRRLDAEPSPKTRLVYRSAVGTDA